MCGRRRRERGPAVICPRADQPNNYADRKDRNVTITIVAWGQSASLHRSYFLMKICSDE